MQYSVFLCELSKKELIYLKRDLSHTLNLADDRALIVDTGPADDNNTKHMTAIGTQTIASREPAIII